MSTNIMVTLRFNNVVMLYPLKFNPVFKEKIWGGQRLKDLLGKSHHLSNCGESWELSGVAESCTPADNGFLQGNTLPELVEIYMGDLVGDQVFRKYGLDFPLLFKYIDSNDWLSVQVHPDDIMAAAKHEGFGKTEMWYVLHAEKGAEMISGFSRKISKQEFSDAVNTNEVMSLLNVVPVQTGDVFFIPAGRVHALGPGIVLAEIQQSSDFTYRIFDFNRIDSSGKARELHLDLAVEAIDYDKTVEAKTKYVLTPNNPLTIGRCEHFVTRLNHLTKAADIDNFRIDSFVVYMCLDGSMEWQGDGNSFHINKGDTWLIPAVLKNYTLTPQPECRFLEVYVPYEKMED